MKLLLKALNYAAQQHSKKGQIRKYTGEPYINHPIAVARLVSTVTDDEAMLAAAVLHDVVEDTDATSADVQRLFGGDVAQLVDELTDVSRPEDGKRAFRKQLDLQHLSNASPRAQTIKLADLLHNSESIFEHDPGFAKVYMAEKRALLEVLAAGDTRLWLRAREAVLEYEKANLPRLCRRGRSSP